MQAGFFTNRGEERHGVERSGARVDEGSQWIAHVRHLDSAIQTVASHLLGVGDEYAVQFRNYINSATGRLNPKSSLNQP